MANIFTKIPAFFKEARQELAKVSWPTRKELFGAAWIVIVAVAILTLYIGGVDFVLSKAVSLVVQ
jgi:preprotein translocase subunit SecE